MVNGTLVRIHNFTKLNSIPSNQYTTNCNVFNVSSLILEKKLVNIQNQRNCKKMKLYLNRNLKKVLIHGDGRCFFRCISVHLVNKLRKCTRSPLGISEFECMEIVLADQIRKEAVSLLKHHEPVSSTLSSSLQFYLDKEMGHQYTTLSERLMCMERTRVC
jgi:hypothetical protein